MDSVVLADSAAGSAGSARSLAPHGKILFLHFIVTVNSVQRVFFGTLSNAHLDGVSFTSHHGPSNRSVSSRFCSVSRVEYASQPTALQLESPPYVVGPSAESSVDALNPTVIPDGIVASPRAIVNVSTHVADGEHTIRQSNSAWHRVASSTVGFALTHVYAGGGHDEENPSNGAVVARAVGASASASAVTARLTVIRCVIVCRPFQDDDDDVDSPDDVDGRPKHRE